ncbi:hypothetical protein SHLI107390_12475 [Shewanella livingstonensis]
MISVTCRTQKIKTVMSPDDIYTPEQKILTSSVESISSALFGCW